MKTSIITNSLVFMTLLVGLTSCYTRLGYLSEAQVYEEYDKYANDDNAIYEDEEETWENDVVVHHVYLPPKYHPRYIAFDPYDTWYFEPGFGFWYNYYSGPVLISVPVYYPPYPYPYPYPYPVYYPPYYHPYPVYYPPVYGGGYHGPHYVHTPSPLKRRDFGRRTEQSYTAQKRVSRRGSESVGSGTVSKRTLTKAPDSGSRDSKVIGRRVSDKRKQKSTIPESKDYSRYPTRKRTETTTKRTTTDDKRRTNKTSNSTPINSGQSKKSDSGYKAPVSRRSSKSSGSVSSSSPRPAAPSVSRSSSGSNSRPSVSRSSGSSGGSRVSSGSAPRSSSSGSSSRSSSSSSGKSRKR